MKVTLNISDSLKDEVSRIPNLSEVLARAIREESKLQCFLARNEHQNIVAIVNEALQSGRTATTPRNEGFQEMRQTLSEIGRQL